MYEFPPTLQAAHERLSLVDPKHYAYSRNDLTGAGSYLSPYLFNADNVEKFAPSPWHSRGALLDTSYEPWTSWRTTPPP